MHLDLVHDGPHTGLGLDAVEVRGQEVRDTDLSHDAALLGVDECGPRLRVEPHRRVRPVDQVQIGRIQPQPKAALLDARARFVCRVMAAGELGRDDHVFAWHGAQLHTPPDSALVLVVEGGVDQTIPRIDTRRDGGRALLAVEPIGAESDSGQGESVVCGEDGVGAHETSESGGVWSAYARLAR